MPTLRQWVNNRLAGFVQTPAVSFDPAVRAEFEWLKKAYFDSLAVGGAGPSFNSPELLETCGRYNLVRYQGRFWAIPLSLGPFDLRLESSQTHTEVLVRNALGPLREIALGVAPHGAREVRGSNPGDGYSICSGYCAASNSASAAGGRRPR